MATTPKILIELGITDSELQKKVAAATETTRRLKEEKALLQVQNKLTAESEARLNAEIKNASDSQRKAENQLKAYIAASKSLEGSIDRSAGVSKVLTAEFNSLSAEERELTERGKQLSAALKVSNDELRNQGVQTGNMRANVGNYTEAINNSLIGLRSQIQALKEQNETLDINSEEFDLNQKKIEELTLQYNVASGKVDEFGDRVKKSAAAENLDRVNDAGQGAAKALFLFGLATGGAAQASENEQKVMQALSIVTAGYAIWKGKAQIAELADAAAKGASTAATKIYTFVTAEATVATQALRIAMLAVPLVAVAAGIAVLVTQTDILTGSTKRQKEAQDRLNQSLDNTKLLANQSAARQKVLNDVNVRAAKDRLDIAIAEGKNQAEINSLRENYDRVRLQSIEKEQNNIATTILQYKGLGEISRQRYVDVLASNIKIQAEIDKLNNKIVINSKSLVENKKAGAELAANVNEGEIKKAELLIEQYTEAIELNSAKYDVNTEANIRNAEAFVKSTADKKAALDDLKQALNEIEERIFEGDTGFRLAELEANYKAEEEILKKSLANKILDEKKYYQELSLLRAEYNLNVREVLNEEFSFDKAVRETQIKAIGDLRAQVNANIATQDESLLNQTKATIDFIGEQTDSFNARQQAQAEQTMSTIKAVGDAAANAISSSFEDGVFNSKKFSKQILGIVIDLIEKQVTAQIAGSVASATAQSFAQPDSVLTFGATGLARTAILIPLIKAVFSVFKSQLGSMEFGGVVPKAANGLLVGPSHSMGGIKTYGPGGPIEMEGGEAVINKRSTAMYAPLLSMINQAGGGVAFANGGMTAAIQAEKSMNIIDYNKLASVFASMNLFVDVTDINSAQNNSFQKQVKTTL